jgi:hypothetical protein
VYHDPSVSDKLANTIKLSQTDLQRQAVWESDCFTHTISALSAEVIKLFSFPLSSAGDLKQASGKAPLFATLVIFIERSGFKKGKMKSVPYSYGVLSTCSCFPSLF